MPVSSLSATRAESRVLSTLLACLLFCSPALASNSPFGGARTGSLGAEPRFLPVDDAFRWHVSLDAADRVSIHWQIAPEYYMYREQFDFQLLHSDLELQVTLPEAIPHQDVYFGDVDVYYNQVSAEIHFSAPVEGAVTLEFRFQGCAEAGLCYPPERRSVEIAP